MLKRFLILAAFLTLAVSNAWASEISLKDPYKMVRQVADQTFQRVARDQSMIEKDKNYLRTVVEEELLPYIDYKYAAYRVLGSYIQKVRTIEDKEEKRKAVENIKQFIDVFRSYLVNTYAGVFTQYTNQKVEFDPEQAFDGDSVVVVKTRIVEEGKPNIDIAFKVRKDKDGDWRAYDMIAEGISLLDAKQSELHGILRTEGIEYVIDLLDKKSKLPVQFKGDKNDA